MDSGRVYRGYDIVLEKTSPGRYRLARLISRYRGKPTEAASQDLPPVIEGAENDVLASAKRYVDQILEKQDN